MMKAGDIKPLNVSPDGNRRVFVGLGWDPSSTARGSGFLNLINRLRGKKPHHDLDLSCFIYDQNQQCVNVISGKMGQIADAQGGIYHSGDDVEGIGEDDDEQISVELNNIPANVFHLVFKTSIVSGHRFEEINSPEIRLVDAYSSYQFFKTSLINEKSAERSDYVFLEIFRTPNAPSDWFVHYVDAYVDSSTSLSRWAERLKAYLTNPSL